MSQHSSILPEALEIRLKRQLGSEFQDFEQSLQTDAPVSIRFNPNKASSHMLGLKPIPWCPQGSYLPSRPNFTLDPLFHAGTYYVQEASSMFLAYMLEKTVDLSLDMRVLDLSAAPGGKSTLLQSLITPDSLMVANEVIGGRNKVLQQNLTRWGGDNHIITQSDPKYFKRLPDFFDLILVDAPCSGEGLFRKDPSAANEWSTHNVRLCAARQKRILADIAPSLAPGGVLIYSTCTFSEEENEDNMRWLMEESGFTPIEVDIPSDWGIQTLDPGFPGYRFYPHHVQGEGFFIAAFQKPSDIIPQRIKIKTRIRFDKPSEEDRHWLSTPDRYAFFMHDQQRIALLQQFVNDYQIITQSLRIRAAGLSMGKLYPKGLKPSAELALSQHLSGNMIKVELNKEEALDYLSHRTISLPSGLDSGHILITHGDHGLGWINLLKTGQIRNNYPTSWRILKR